MDRPSILLGSTVLNLLDPILDMFRSKAVTIPPMDGALKPNTSLDDGEVMAAALAPDNLAIHHGVPIYSSHGEIRQLGRHLSVLETCPADVSALAVAEDGTLAVALDDGSLRIGQRTVDGFNCITGLAFHSGKLFVTNGSDHFRPSQWVRDLMNRNAAGSLWEVNASTGQRRLLAGGLGFANGVAVDVENDRLIISESWRHRLAAIPLSGGHVAEGLRRLPAYPARISTVAGGFVLALFAPLNRLVEFVLQERRYRADMMREIDSRYWIAPTLSPPDSFLEPLQNGSVRSMGVHKPWSPTRSYGLVATLDRRLQPVASFHSRANGRFHGVTSAIAFEGAILAASKGGNHIIRLNLGDRS